jgi:IS30 family transposase
MKNMDIDTLGFKGSAQHLRSWRFAVTVLRDQQRLFWCLVRDGASTNEAGRRLGVSQAVSWRWFREAGGMPPLPLSPPARGPGSRLDIDERELILAGLVRGDSIRAIARDLCRAPSTISRELRVNMFHQRYGQRHLRGPGFKAKPPWRYQPHLAQLRAEKNAARPKPAKLACCARLRDEVQMRLQQEHSPEQIAASLVVEFPDDAEMRVSPETIYQSLYVQGRGALRRDLTVRLRTGRALRKPRRRADERRGRLVGMVNISERPAEVADRAVPGHWEGDLIIGSTVSKSAIGTLVERTTRFVILLHLIGGHGADIVQEAMIAAMAGLPETLRKTLTWDQGREMANHAKIAAATGLDIYFCDPHSPWQRGSNENTNGLLRQYFPKGTDLSVYQADYLEHVARKLNTRPRKTLDWRTPAQALDQLLSQPQQPPGVALTG